jgi:CubicO group peptidase (beta-lactamase class C family)
MASLEVKGSVHPDFSRVRDAFHDNFTLRGDIGAAVCVYRHGEVVVDLWAGQADHETGRNWTEDTLQFLFSTTKAVTATCAHVLHDRGLIDYDAPVATYWPEFAAGGKGDIPVRWLLSHAAGLPVLDIPVSPAEALATRPVVEAIARQVPVWEPGTAHGLHILTYGWLVGELVRRVSGRPIGEFFADEIAAPLGLDLWLGLPADQWPRASRSVESNYDPTDVDITAVPELMRPAIAALADPDSLTQRAYRVVQPLLDYGSPEVARGEVPSVNGMATARSLARFYASLIGEVDGVRLLSPSTLKLATAQQFSGIDGILKLPSRVAMGFDLPWEEDFAANVFGGPGSFGHAGYGGPGAFADPDTGVAFGYVTSLHAYSLRGNERCGALADAVRESVQG